MRSPSHQARDGTTPSATCQRAGSGALAAVRTGPQPACAVAGRASVRASSRSRTAMRRLYGMERYARRMPDSLITELTVFALAVFVGFEVISKVPQMLH